MPDRTRFEQFLTALDALDLDDEHGKVTAHTSAVSIRWGDVLRLDRDVDASDRELAR